MFDSKWFDVRDLIREVPDANIYMVFGERTGGKTYSSMSYCLDRLIDENLNFVYVRRLAESIRMQYMRNLFTGNRKTGDLKNHISKFGWDDLGFYSGAFWGMIENEKGKLQRVEVPCGYTMAISTWETAKGGSIPYAKTIVFDEFLTRGTYFYNEPAEFENLISSVFREEGDGKVIMLGNTVSWSCPYFRHYGIENIKDMKQGSYSIYQKGERKVVVCYAPHVENKASNVFFDAENTRSRMILNGTWETADYAKLPEQIGEWYQGTPCYVQSIEGWCAKIVPCSTPEGMECLLVFNCRRQLIDEAGIDVRYKDRIVYTDVFYPFYNCRMAMTKHNDKLTAFLIKCFKQGRVFYQTDEVGENIRNYLKWSNTYNPITL